MLLSLNLRSKKINTRSPAPAQRNDPCPCGSGKKYKKCCLLHAAALPAQSADGFQSGLNLAQAAVLRQDFIAAEAAFRQLLGLQKQSAVALAGLGQCLCQLNRPQEGIPFLSLAAKVLQGQARQSGDIKNLLDLAYQLLHWHAPAEALLQVKAGLAINGRVANAWHIAALCLQSLNRHQEAYTHALRAVELAPQDVNALILLAVLETKLGKTEQAIRRLKWVIAQPLQADSARAHQELGVALDKHGQYDQAFTHLARAGQITLQSAAACRLDRQAVFREMAAFKAEYDAGFMQSTGSRREDDGLPAPVFLIGFYRSGTTLAEQVLAAHPQVVSSDEALLMPPVLAELYRISAAQAANQAGLSPAARIKALTAADIAHLRAFYWQTARQRLGEQVMQRVLVDKTALNILNIELINCLFPEALLIFAVRDPRDVCLSCFMQPFGLSALTANFLDWNDTAGFYALIMDYWLTIRHSLAMPWLELRYEDVLDDLEGQFRPLFAKMGLDWSAECAEFYRHAQGKVISTPSFDQVTRPLYRTSAQRWLHYQSQVALVLPLLEAYIKAFGYRL